jgi:molybdenum cofactor cytidylyltransferase
MVPAVILAGGLSSRMGRDKAFLPLPGGGWFLSRLARTFLDAGCSRVIAVVGPAIAAAVDERAAREGLPVAVLVNPDPSRGQLSSLHEALAHLAGSRPPGVLACPVDQPLVSAGTVRKVLDAWLASGAPIVRPVRAGRHGHPVLFDAALLPELLAADIAAGARPVIRAHAGEAVDVPIDDPGAYEDIDTPEDCRRVFGVDLSAPGTATT